MSDNDTIKRGDVKDVLEKSYYGEATFGELLEAVDAIPAVAQEMTAAEYIHISNRILKEDYRAWDRLMFFEENDDADKAIAWMEEWAREHPEERSEADE